MSGQSGSFANLLGGKSGNASGLLGTMNNQQSPSALGISGDVHLSPNILPNAMSGGMVSPESKTASAQPTCESPSSSPQSNMIKLVNILSARRRPENIYALAVGVLSEPGCNPNEPLDDGATALHWTSYTGEYAVLQLLLNANADPCVVNKVGQTPLHWASMNGRIPAIRMLLAAGAHPLVACEVGYTVLHYAARYGHSFTVDYLWSSGAPLDAVDREGRTALHLAVQNGQTMSAKVLIERGASLGATDMYGATPLHLGAEAGKEDLVRALVRFYGGYRYLNARASLPSFQTTHHRDANLLASEVAAAVGRTRLAKFLKSRMDKSIPTHLEMMMCRDDAGKDASMWWIGRWLVYWLVIWELHFFFVVERENQASMWETIIFHILAIAAVITWIVCHVSDPGYILPAPPPAFAVSPWELIQNLRRMKNEAKGMNEAKTISDASRVRSSRNQYEMAINAITGEAGEAGEDLIPPSITLFSHSTHGLALAQKHIREYESAHPSRMSPETTTRLRKLRDDLNSIIARAQQYRLSLLRSLPPRPALSIGVAMRKAMGWWTVDQQRALVARLRHDTALAAKAISNCLLPDDESLSNLGDEDEEYSDSSVVPLGSSGRWRRQYQAALAAAVSASSVDKDLASWLSKYIGFIDPLNGKFAQPHLYGNLLRVAALERKHVAVKVVALAAAHQQKLDALQSHTHTNLDETTSPQSQAIEMSNLNRGTIDMTEDEGGDVDASAQCELSASRRRTQSASVTLPSLSNSPDNSDTSDKEKDFRNSLSASSADSIRIQMDSTEIFGRPIVTVPKTQQFGISPSASSSSMNAQLLGEVSEWTHAMQVIAPFDLDVEARIHAARWRCKGAAAQIQRQQAEALSQANNDIVINLNGNDITGTTADTAKGTHRLGYDATRGIFAGPLAMLKVVDHMTEINASANEFSLEYCPPEESRPNDGDAAFDFETGNLRQHMLAPKNVARITSTRPYLTFAHADAIAQETQNHPSANTTTALFAPSFSPAPATQLPSVLATDIPLDSEDVPHGGECLGCDCTPMCDAHCCEPIPGKGGWCCNISSCGGEDVEAFDEAGAFAGCLGVARIQSRETARLVLDALVRERQAIVSVVTRSHKYAAGVAARMRERKPLSQSGSELGFSPTVNGNSSSHESKCIASTSPRFTVQPKQSAEPEEISLLLLAEDRERAAAERAAQAVESSLRNALLPVGYAVTPASGSIEGPEATNYIDQHVPLAANSPPPSPFVSVPISVVSHDEHKHRGKFDWRGSTYCLPRTLCKVFSTLCFTIPRQCGTRAFAYSGSGVSADSDVASFGDVTRLTNVTPTTNGTCGSLCSALDCAYSTGTTASHAQLKPSSTKTPTTVSEFEFAAAAVAAVATRAIEVEADEAEGGFSGSAGHEESNVGIGVQTTKALKNPAHVSKSKQLKLSRTDSGDGSCDDAMDTSALRQTHPLNSSSGVRDLHMDNNVPNLNRARSSALGSPAHIAAMDEAHRHCSTPNCTGCYICEPALPHPPNAALAGLRYHAMISLGAGSHHTLCSICRVAKPFRSMHCNRCNRCVYRMDHHCPWVDNCVGANNYRSFMLFITLGTILSIWYSYRTFQSLSLEQFDMKNVVSFGFALHSTFMALFVFMLWCSHMYLVSINASTQEHIVAEQHTFNRGLSALDNNRFDYGFINNWRQFFRGYAREPIYFPKDNIPPAVQDATLLESETNAVLTAALGAITPVDLVVPPAPTSVTPTAQTGRPNPTHLSSPTPQIPPVAQTRSPQAIASAERMDRFANALLASVQTSNPTVNAAAAAAVSAAVQKAHAEKMASTKQLFEDLTDDDDDDVEK